MLSNALNAVISAGTGIAARSDSGNISPIHRVTLVDSRAGAVNLTLPDAAECPGLAFVIKDRYGSAGTNSITISGIPGQLIDDQVSFIIGTSFESITIISDGWSYFVA